MGLNNVVLTPGDIEEQVRGLMSRKYISRDYLRLFQAVFEAQYQTEMKLQADDLYPPVTKEEADKRVGQGLPVIDPAKLQVGEREIKDLLRQICATLAEQTGGENLESAWLLEAIESGQLNPTEMTRKVLAYDRGYFEQLSEEMSKDKEGVIFIVTALVAPFLRVCATSVRDKVDLDLALTKRCPVCGGAPLMAKLRREDGKRMLECSLCNTQWIFERLKCPFCSNEEQGTLGFFFIEEESAYRVYKCDKCKRYIKTVDERKMAEGKPRALVVEDVATLYLDMAAVEEGYQSIRESRWD